MFLFISGGDHTYPFILARILGVILSSLLHQSLTHHFSFLHGSQIFLSLLLGSAFTFSCLGACHCLVTGFLTPVFTAPLLPVITVLTGVEINEDHVGTCSLLRCQGACTIHSAHRPPSLTRKCSFTGHTRLTLPEPPTLSLPFRLHTCSSATSWLLWVPYLYGAGASFLLNSVIETWFTNHTIQHRIQQFLVYSEFCNHHYNLSENIFII